MLMALTSASRASLIHHLDIRYMVKKGMESMYLNFTGSIKADDVESQS